MAEVHVLVLRAAGINCDEEVMHAWRLAGARPTLVHVNALAASPAMLDDFQIVTIPGGFSYGDDIAAGVILAQRLLLDLAEPLQRLVDRGGGLLGICNGFQVLVKTGLLPGGDAGRGQVTVTYNDSARFEARWVRLEVCTDRCVFLTPISVDQSRAAGFSLRGPTQRRRMNKDGASGTHPTRLADETPRGLKPAAREGGTQQRLYLEMPVEHAEGKVVTAGEDVLHRLKEGGQIAVRYVDTDGCYDRYPANPNGSVGGIAGLCDPTGRVFGLMPHPDRHFTHTHHPYWTRRRPQGPPDGLTVFQNAVGFWGAQPSI